MYLHSHEPLFSRDASLSLAYPPPALSSTSTSMRLQSHHRSLIRHPQFSRPPLHHHQPHHHHPPTPLITMVVMYSVFGKQVGSHYVRLRNPTLCSTATQIDLGCVDSSLWLPSVVPPPLRSSPPAVVPRTSPPRQSRLAPAMRRSSSGTLRAAAGRGCSH